MLDLEQGGCTKSKWHQERHPRLDAVVMFALAQAALGHAAQVNRSRSSGSRPFLASALCSPFSVLRLSMFFPLSDPPVGNARWFATHRTHLFRKRGVICLEIAPVKVGGPNGLRPRPFES